MEKSMSEFAMINHLVGQGWKMIDNKFFTLNRRTDSPVDLQLAYFIQRQLERARLREQFNAQA
jgi:hypothetical protein